MKQTEFTREALKKLHQKQIFMLARGAGISRAELARRMKLSFPSITALVDELIERRLLTETGFTEAQQRGRPRSLLRVNSNIIYVPAFELERDGYRFSLYNICGELEREGFLPFKSRGDSSSLWLPTNEELASPIAECIASLEGKYRLSDILLSIPGNIYEDGSLSSSAVNLKSEENFPTFVEEKTSLRMYTLNTADSLAYAERVYSDVGKNYIYINISDGIGAGIIHDGRIFKCGSRRVGEIGHLSIDFNGPPCPCGARGCLERYASIGVITEEARQILNDQSIQFSDIASAFKSGNEAICELIAKKAEMIAVAINSALKLHHAEKIIIGGTITELGEGFETIIQMAFAERLSRMSKNICKLNVSKNHSHNCTVGIFNEYVDNNLQINNLF